jgi:large subunit ribosomal protein L11
MIKKYKEIFKLTINAGQANASPPIGPMLGQRGINIMEFSKEFNNNTKNLKEETLIPVNIILNKNRSFNLNINKPISSYFFKKITNITKGSTQAKHNIINTIKIQDIYEIAQLLKYEELPLKSVCKILIASANSMGIKTIK